MGYKIQAGGKTWIHDYIVAVDVIQNMEWFVQQGQPNRERTINMKRHFKSGIEIQEIFIAFS